MLLQSHVGSRQHHCHTSRGTAPGIAELPRAQGSCPRLAHCALHTAKTVAGPRASWSVHHAIHSSWACSPVEPLRQPLSDTYPVVAVAAQQQPWMANVWERIPTRVRTPPRVP